MKHLVIPKGEKGKGESVYCTSCNRNVGLKCHRTKRKIHTCKFPESHNFKASYHVPGTVSTKITKQFETRDFKKFKELKMEFFEWLKAQNVNADNYREVRKSLVDKEMAELEAQDKSAEVTATTNQAEEETSQPSNEESTAVEKAAIQRRTNQNKPANQKPMAYKDVVAMFLDHMAGADGIKIKTKKRSDKYVEELSIYYSYFAQVLKKLGHDAARFPIDEVGDEELMAWHDFLEDSTNEDGSKRFGKYAYNKGIGFLSKLYRYLIEKKDYNIKDPFKDINRKSINRKMLNDAIWPNEFAVLLKLVSKKNGWGKKMDRGHLRNKQYWRPWLKLAFQLAIETGERRDGIALMRWSDIDMRTKEISILNHKVSKIKQEEVERIIPITVGLDKILRKLGYKEHKDSNDYLIDPQRENRRGVMDDLSKGFMHFWNLTGIKKKTKMTFKRLRKTYATMMYMYFGDRAESITGQTIDNMIRNYVDQRLLMLKARNLSIDKIYQEVFEEYDI